MARLKNDSDSAIQKGIDIDTRKGLSGAMHQIANSNCEMELVP